MTSKTEFKLEEARFFLRHVEHHWRNVPEIDFYLSAFISAARSVTWVMAAEFGTKPGWREWYDKKAPKPAVRALLRGMTNLRNRSVKAHPVRTRTTAKIIVAPEHLTPEVLAFLEDGAKGQVNLEALDPSNTRFVLKQGERVLAPVTLEHAEHHLPEFAGRDAKDVCSEYLAELEALVNECIAKFAA
ncbi:MAG: hypothetical protein KIT60_12085 [Burkholderiaceae bacterium]|nr:hypothetical protein [Burkholderiaceae bacterium]